ncbi:MAG: hypothetical protein QF570_03155 [Myxococcota bacterium]|jgi:hypothetical protein|nr:hypothetical protein [Myxococcota bacterium]
MKFQQRIRLIATLAAIIMLQAPFCAVACTLEPTPPPSDAAHTDMPPCHGASNDTEVPAAPHESNEDCGCDDALQAAIPAPGQNTPANPTAQLTLALPLAPSLAQAHATYLLAPLRETDLPPPKILLLKQSFLI